MEWGGVGVVVVVGGVSKGWGGGGYNPYVSNHRRLFLWPQQLAEVATVQTSAAAGRTNSGGSVCHANGTRR